MKTSVSEIVLRILRENGPLDFKELKTKLEKQKISLERAELNSLLYGELRSLVTKDLDSSGNQVWKLSGQKFTATKGLEFSLYKALLDQKIISTENSQLDYAVTNRRNRKVYHLDIAIFLKKNNVISALSGNQILDQVEDESIVGKNVRKINIEVDGFDHLRADAMYSIQKQLREKRREIDIDWMDHERSFIDFKSIDSDAIYTWCMKNADWCRTYHEELLWPKDITRNLWLIENGWEIMRVWNFEVKHELKRVLSEIQTWIR